MTRRGLLALVAAAPLIPLAAHAAGGTSTVDLGNGVRLEVHDIDGLVLKSKSYVMYAIDGEPLRFWANDCYCPGGTLVHGRGVLFVNPSDVDGACR